MANTSLLCVRIIYVVLSLLLICGAFAGLIASFFHVNKELTTVNLIVGLIFAVTILEVISLGLWAGVMKKYVGVLVHLGFLSIFFVAYIAIVVQSYLVDVKAVAKGQLDEKWKSQLDKKEGLDKLQREYECCGVEQPEDYIRNQMSYPKSCYPPNGEAKEAQRYKVGCYHLLRIIFIYEFKNERIIDWFCFGACLLNIAITIKLTRLLILARQSGGMDTVEEEAE